MNKPVLRDVKTILGFITSFLLAISGIRCLFFYTNLFKCKKSRPSV